MNKDFKKLGIDLRIFENPIDPIDLIKSITSNTNIDHDPFYVVDLEDICNKHINWITALPRVEPHYAIKCNGDPMLLKLLAFLGAGFDCASKNEIQTILDLGVSADRIIYANPCKQASYIRYACKNGIDLMTFDNENELYKIKDNHPNAKIVLRIITNDANAICKFSMKFGADMQTSYKLIDVAMKLNLDLVGVSFHVGSGQMSPEAFSESIQNARSLFDYALNEHGHKMSLLDLGGGYPGSSESAELFNSIAKEINFALDSYFPEDSGVKIIAEPGRYYACSAFTLCLNVIAKRNIEELKTKSFMYYVNDGVYASFNCMFYDHVDGFQPIIIKDSHSNDEAVYESSIWGPTCDGLDCISKKIQLPELDTGDFMAFRNMGAYTIAGACAFNGIPLPKTVYMASTSWNTIKRAFYDDNKEYFQQNNKTAAHLAAFTRALILSQKDCCAEITTMDTAELLNQIEEFAMDENCVISC